MKELFNDDEWFLLSTTPAAIGALMSAAAPSGVIGTIKEVSASMRATVQGLQTHSNSELIALLLKRSDNWSESKDKVSDYRERMNERFENGNVPSRNELETLVLNDCGTVATLVDERCSAEEAAAYKDWCVTIAVKVAEASKEGSTFGFGGARVSDAEIQQLAKIESSLGVASGKLQSLLGTT